MVPNLTCIKSGVPISRFASRCIHYWLDRASLRVGSSIDPWKPLNFFFGAGSLNIGDQRVFSTKLPVYG